MLIGVSTRKFESEYGVIKGVPISYLKNIDFILIDSENYNVTLLNKLLEMVDGILLPGGDEVSKVDQYLIHYCYTTNKPLLGICLGMQEIATYFKSKIIKINSSSHFNFSALYQHSININKHSYLYNLLNTETISVNSRHRYTIENNINYEVMAYSDDNIIEAIKVNNTYYMIGYQFHPEAMIEYDTNAQILINDFIDKVKSNH